MGDYRIFGPAPLNVSAAGAMTGTTVITSSAIDAGSYQSSAFQAIWTGTPVGVITVLASLDGINWSDLSPSIPVQPAGSAGSVFIPIYAACAKWLKLQYSNTSGTGTLSVQAMSKTR